RDIPGIEGRRNATGDSGFAGDWGAQQRGTRTTPSNDDGEMWATGCQRYPFATVPKRRGGGGNGSVESLCRK
ncbi:hypothetical protein PIB30_092875, partial [Stylosanthes scabra]|nr:hypothetical protein [Stylosanthes scabra]